MLPLCLFVLGSSLISCLPRFLILSSFPIFFISYLHFLSILDFSIFLDLYFPFFTDVGNLSRSHNPSFLLYLLHSSPRVFLLFLNAILVVFFSSHKLLPSSISPFYVSFPIFSSHNLLPSPSFSPFYVSFPQSINERWREEGARN